MKRFGDAQRMCWMLNCKMGRSYLSEVLKHDNICKSPLYASLVGLIRNLGTGYISPQFRVVYDNKFETVIGGYDENNSLLSHIWDSLVHNNSENVLQQVILE